MTTGLGTGLGPNSEPFPCPVSKRSKLGEERRRRMMLKG
jgi:hypothetical protein